MKRVNREDLSWCAGFIEGEGSFSLRVDERRLSLSVGQSNLQRLEKLKNSLHCGSIQGPYKPRTDGVVKGKKQSWRYRVASFEDTQAIIAMLWPFFTPDFQVLIGQKFLARKQKLGPYYKGHGRPRKLNSDQEQLVIRLYNRGKLNQYQLAKKFGVSQPQVHRILKEAKR